MKTLTLVALLVFVVSVSGFPWLKDVSNEKAGREYLKREFIERLKEKITEKMADKTNGVENNDLVNSNEAATELDKLDAIMPQIDDEINPEADIKDESTNKGKFVENNIANDESNDETIEETAGREQLKREIMERVIEKIAEKMADKTNCVGSNDLVSNSEAATELDELDAIMPQIDDEINPEADIKDESTNKENLVENNIANDNSDDEANDETVDPVKMVSKSYLNRLMNVVENLDNGVRTQDSDILKTIEIQQMIQSKILKLTEAMIRGGFIEVPLNETTSL